MAEKFYHTMLELPVERTHEHLVVTVGWTKLVISGSGAVHGAQHLAFEIPRNQFEPAKQWLKSRTSLFWDEGADDFEGPESWNSRSVYFEGPDGSVLELIVRRDVPNDKEGTFSGASILGVSEVGVPVTDVSVFEREAQKIGLEPFGPGGPRFRPLGDENGLLIAVERGREWFPTEYRAVPDRLDIEVDVDGVGEIVANELTRIRVV
ncbi:hypothetical protein [Lysinibacter sp. HNR]|uniref:hypothetical protein n=1 Tax=Lysinibacter sp. HNR TaxID=3031408 RepID=UPI002435B1F7|nr:hypothetical protein [Lysinibacter sp. HNR]WGD37637.1 hypothetical protein FrondiHNR_01590 [Lysinibacter sp. HNR]